MRWLGFVPARLLLVAALGLSASLSFAQRTETTSAQRQTTKLPGRSNKQIEKTLDPLAWGGTERRTADPHAERVEPTMIDTRRFANPIDETYHEVKRKPRNPQFPDWMYSVFPPNALPVSQGRTATATTPRAQWPAIDSTGWAPPDPSLAVGRNHVVVVVNSSISFHTRTGTKQFQQTFENFVSGLGAGSFLFDPKAYYDRHSDRFVVVVLEQDDDTLTSKAIVAISDDGDPNGIWYKYRFDTKVNVNGTDFWLDYPGFGYNRNAIAVSGNLFQFNGNAFAGVLFLMADKAPMLTGAAVTARTIRDGNAITTQLTQVLDPNESRIFAINYQNTQFLKIHALNDPASAAPTQTSAFVQIPAASAPQYAAYSVPGFLDTLDGRLFNVSLRNGNLTASHAIHNTGVDNSKVRWYELGLNAWPSSGTVSLLQSGEIVPPDDSTEFHMPAIGQNVFGDVSVLFTRSALTIPADLMVASRTLGDAAGTMGSPVLLKSSEGTGYGGTNRNRWGDYFDVNVDPLDDVTFWGVGMVGNPSNNWRTHVYSWTVTPPAVVSAVTATPAEVLGGTDGFNLTVQLASPAPAAGVTVKLSSSDSSVIVPSGATISGGSSQVTVPVTTTTVTSARTVTISATATGSTNTTSVTVQPRRISGTVTLASFAGSLAGKSLTIGVRNAGSTTNLETVTATLTAGGGFAFYTTRTGTLDLALEVPGFLRKVIRVTVPTSGVVTASAALANGDADRDNRVTTTDFTIVNRAFGATPASANWDARADLNGDGIVNGTDIAIVQNNQRLRGDA
jgi:hypothetical protein